MLDKIWSALSSILLWIWEHILWLPQYAVHKLLTALSEFFAKIPIPDFISAIPGYFSAIPDDVVYFMTILEFKYGVTVMISALIARFILRRIPFIGG